MWGKVCVLRLSCLILVLPFAWAAGLKSKQVNYCRNRKPSECCDDRLDDCAVKTSDSYCYCDDFCLNNDDSVDIRDDCCPDYWEVCLGMYPKDPSDPKQGCERDGIMVPHNDTHKFNCNLCKCESKNLKCEEDACLVEEATIKRVNHGAGGYTWRATNYTKFWGWKAKKGVKLRTGTVAPTFVMHPIQLSPVASLIPREFDARMKLDWRDLISRVRDQGWCGASWAFSSVAVAQDRLAIGTEDGVRQLSPEHVLECAGQSGDTCIQGGHVDRAWQYLRRIGVVREECLRYHTRKFARIPECRVPQGSTSSLQCQNPALYKMEPAYRISSKEGHIQWEIMNEGPVQALMRVSPELFVYASGVYQCDGRGEDGGVSLHAVRLVGWGDEVLQPGASPTKYWVVANSWGEDWGERGYFRIRRGSDECGIESYVLAVRPRNNNYKLGK